MEILSPLQELDDSLRAFRRPFLRHAPCTLSSPLPPFPSFLPSTTVRHHFDNLIIRYRYANNRRTRYSPLAPIAREDREIAFSPILIPLPLSVPLPHLSSSFSTPPMIKFIPPLKRLVQKKMIIRSGLDFYSGNEESPGFSVKLQKLMTPVRGSSVILIIRWRTCY